MHLASLSAAVRVVLWGVPRQQQKLKWLHMCCVCRRRSINCRVEQGKAELGRAGQGRAGQGSKILVPYPDSRCTVRSQGHGVINRYGLDESVMGWGQPVLGLHTIKPPAPHIHPQLPATAAVIVTGQELHATGTLSLSDFCLY